MGLVQLHRLEQRACSGSASGKRQPVDRIGKTVAPHAMSASELMYFFGAPLAHVVSYEDHLRTSRCEKTIRVVTRSRRAPDFYAQIAPSPYPVMTPGGRDEH